MSRDPGGNFEEKMGKKGEELWDDSALINAFDRAISNYKVMHGKGGQESSSAGGEAISSAEQNSEALISERDESKRDSETGDANNVALTTQVEETINPSSVKGSLADDNGTGHYIGSSNGQTVDNSSSETHVEDYNHLLSQYYEVEDQRQKILQQLYQYGESSTWNYQGTDSSVPWGTSSASQENQVPTQSSLPTNSMMQLGTTSASREHQVPAPQLSCSTVACCCCSYMCPLGTSTGTCTGKLGNDTSAAGQNGLSVEKDDLVKTAMRAADRALSSMKTRAFGGANTSDTEGKERRLETDAGQSAQSCSSETDLSVVFNAWYSAGFYTCKYLMEQSAAKK